MIDTNSKLKILTFGGVAHQWKPLIEDTLDNVEVIHCRNRKTMEDRYEDVQILFGWKFPEQLFARMPDLRWIQNLSVGIDAFINNPDIDSTVQVTNTGRLYGDTIAEYVIWAMITLSRRFHRTIHNQRRRRWQQVFGPSLSGRTVGIAGLGDVGLNVAALSAAHGMKTLGIVRPDQLDQSFDHVSRLASIQDLDSVVGDCDALVLSLPLTDETHGLINEELIGHMHSESILINTARAEIADQSAIIRAVRNGTIAGAALDVFEKEPLRRWDPVWSVDNILVTPHTSSMSTEYKTRVADLIQQNMIRFVDGRPLINEIDRERGF